MVEQEQEPALEGDAFEGTRMTLGEHLQELRTRLLRGVGVVLLAFFVSYLFRNPIARVVMWPFRRAMGMLREYARELGKEVVIDDRLMATGPAEAFFFSIQTCFYFALFVGAPILLWQLWQFVAAGLYPHERKAMLRYFPWSVLLFLVGALFGYFVLVPYGIYFLGRTLDFELVRPDYKISEYFSMLSALVLALGLVFQLPILMAFLARIGLVAPETFTRYRAHFIVGAFIVSAIMTPPDPYTQTMMALPMAILFEIGILAARWGAQPRQHPGGGGNAGGAR